MTKKEKILMILGIVWLFFAAYAFGWWFYEISYQINNTKPIQIYCRDNEDVLIMITDDGHMITDSCIPQWGEV